MFRINRNGEPSLGSLIYDYFESNRDESFSVYALKKYIVNDLRNGARFNTETLGVKISKVVQKLLSRGVIVSCGFSRYRYNSSGDSGGRRTPMIATEDQTKTITETITPIDEIILKSYDREGEPTILSQVYQCFLANPGKPIRAADVKRYLQEHFPNSAAKYLKLTHYINLLMSRNQVVSLRWGVWMLNPSVVNPHSIVDQQSPSTQPTTFQVQISAETTQNIDIPSLQASLNQLGLTIINIGVTIK